MSEVLVIPSPYSSVEPVGRIDVIGHSQMAEGGASLGECSALASAGADFVGVSALVWQDARGPAASVAELRQAIAR